MNNIKLDIIDNKNDTGSYSKEIVESKIRMEIDKRVISEATGFLRILHSKKITDEVKKMILTHVNNLYKLEIADNYYIRSLQKNLMSFIGQSELIDIMDELINMSLMLSKLGENDNKKVTQLLTMSRDFSINKNLENYNLSQFADMQKNVAKFINFGSKEGKRIRDKISDEKWWEIQSLSRNEDISCVNCFPNKTYCCYFNLSYHTFFVMSIMFGVFMHYVDLGSDILVLLDLRNNDREYFSICLFIFILSSLVNALVSTLLISNKEDPPDKSFSSRFDSSCCSTKKDILKRVGQAFLGLFQINILIDAYYSIKKRTKEHGYIFGKFMEGLFEGSPQSLFQLFIVLKNSETHNVLDLGRYYFSISISVINLALASVFFEIYWYRNVCKLEYKGNHVRGVDELTFFSPYILNLIVFRLLELTSRMTLLSCLSYATNSGLSIIIALLIDFILQTLLPLTNTDIRKSVIQSSPYSLKCKDYFEKIGLFMMYSFTNVPNLPVLWRPFSTRMNPSLDYKDLYHYPIKLLTTIPIMIIILVKLFTSTYSLSFLVLSIIGLVSFPLSFINLYYIWKWNGSNSYFIASKRDLPKFLQEDTDKYVSKFKGIDLCCRSKSKKDHLNKIL
jgi:hypothetical protein